MKALNTHQKSWPWASFFACLTITLLPIVRPIWYNSTVMERCPSGLRSWSWKPVTPQGAVGSNPTLSATIRCYPLGSSFFTFLRRIAGMRSSLVAFLTIYITQIQEEHGVLSHRWAPSQKNASGYRTHSMHQKYVAVPYYTKITHMQKNTIYSGTNLTLVSVCGGIYRVLSLSYIRNDRHILPEKYHFPVACAVLS